MLASLAARLFEGRVIEMGSPPGRLRRVWNRRAPPKGSRDDVLLALLYKRIAGSMSIDSAGLSEELAQIDRILDGSTTPRQAVGQRAFSSSRQASITCTSSAAMRGSDSACPEAGISRNSQALQPSASRQAETGGQTMS